MANNSFGKVFRITTFGESHGEALGVIIDGCPAGLKINDNDINAELALRKAGGNEYVSPRIEPDKAKIVSGVFTGKTTGTPIAIVIENKNPDCSKYAPIKNLLRPGHANFTYLEKYGIFDYCGGGRASARETVCRVAAGAIAKKILQYYKIQLAAFVQSIGDIVAHIDINDITKLKQVTYKQSIFCPDKTAAKSMLAKLNEIKQAGDSIGGTVGFIIANHPAGLGEPIYDKLEARLASAMMSIPAAKGFSIGSGFEAAKMQGSQHNDIFINNNGVITTKTNYAGGVLAGITTGMPLIGQVAFKPIPSIKKPQETINLQKQKTVLQLPENSQHDICAAIRAVPIVEAMCALVIADFLLLNRCAKLDSKE